jgi:hypothetical protein
VTTYADLRRAALALPGVEEVPFHPSSSEWMLRVGKRGFAYSWQGGALLRLMRGRLEFLKEVRPDTFRTFALPGGNWAQVDLADLEEDELARLVREAWAGVAPAKLRKSLPA